MADKEKIVKIAGLTGSLRKNSYNKAALMAAMKLLPENTELEILDLSDIPFFNEDVEEEGIPDSVLRLKEKLSEADALLISTPEYNYSIPPVLKNAIDWVSRDDDTPIYGKYLGLLSASPSPLGGARAQYHLRQVCVCVNLIPLNEPEIFIASAHTKFDEKGELKDETAKELIKELLAELVKKVRCQREENG
jgi:chromate reductase